MAGTYINFWRRDNDDGNDDNNDEAGDWRLAAGGWRLEAGGSLTLDVDMRRRSSGTQMLMR